MRLLFTLVVLVAGLGAACGFQPQVVLQPVIIPSGAIADEASNIPVPPDRDLLEVAGRLRSDAGPIPRVVNPTPPNYSVGARETFWLSDIQGARHFTTTATLRYVTPHTYMYVEDGQDVPQADIESSARKFEDHIFPTITRYYGESWYSGIDNDTHLTVINARVPSVAGYFSAADQYPTQVNPYSNQRKAIYMNLGAVRPGSPGYNAVLAHEFQHALYWGIKPNGEAWINEGAAELAAEVSGFPSGFTTSFLNQPDTQLDTWPEEPGSSPPHYGAAMLFLKYVAQRFGGYEALGELLSAPGRARASITNFLTAKGHGTDFDAVFKDWVVANYLAQAGGGRYGYTQGPSPAKSQTISQVGTQEGTVHQYAADYLELGFSSGNLQVDFQGDPRVKLIPNQPHSGQTEWWSNRGDSMDSTLTREFDLRGVQEASLRFWTWYDVEERWDYVYVEVSVDNGKTWSILPGKSSTLDNPLGNSFGPGYTGASGGGKDPVWAEETVDLSPIVGRKALIRFEYITDEAVNLAGFALDDISIPEIGFYDDAEQDQLWEPRGFFRTTNSMRQKFSLQVIKEGAGAVVEEVPVDQDGRASLALTGLGRDIRKAVLIIAALTPATTELAPYRLNISQPVP